MNRVQTGVPGLDKIISGGIPEKDLILMSGMSGAGKTIFGLQFLYSQAMKTPGIYVSFEEELDHIRDAASAFGWDICKMENLNRIRVLKYDPFRLEDILEIIESNIREIKAKRVVIDSISALGVYMKDPTELRRMILQISSVLRKNGCTSVLISEILSPNRLSRFGVEEFVTDGVIILNNMLVGGEYRRGINIWKMHNTDHSRKIHPYKITADGFTVFPDDTISVIRQFAKQ
jgi:KaiC/GvpD/RAD55 family RecA-like ATPase